MIATLDETKNQIKDAEKLVDEIKGVLIDQIGEF